MPDTTKYPALFFRTITVKKCMDCAEQTPNRPYPASTHLSVPGCGIHL
jgi:hypothetical protein